MTQHDRNEHDPGLICAFDLDGKGSGRELTLAEIDTPVPAGQVRWIHIDQSVREGRDWIKHQSGIDDSNVEAMLESDIRPRSLQADEGILVTLRGVNLNKDSDVEDMVSIRVWLEPGRIISVRRRSSLSVKQIREDLQAGNGPVGPAAFLIQLLSYLGNHIAGVIDNLDQSIEAAESALVGDSPSIHPGELGELRRETAHLRRYLAPQREALDRLSRMQSEIFGPDDLVELFEETNRMTLFVEELDLARERSMVAREEMLSVLVQKQNSKMYLLSLVAAIFLPLSFITGVMGMNTAGLPGVLDPMSFTYVAILMLVTSFGILLIFRSKKWM